MALRHHERHFATRSAHTLEAILSHDTANHPAHQRHTAFTPACFALPSGGKLFPVYYIWTTKATSESSSKTVSYETSSKSEAPSLQNERFANSLQNPCFVRDVLQIKCDAPSLQNERFVQDFLHKRSAKSSKRAFRTRLPPKKVRRQVSKTSASYKTSSKSAAPSLHNERSPQRAASCAKSKTRSHLHFVPSTRAISAEDCAGQIKNAISPALRAFDAHDLRRGLRRTRQKRNLTCISRPRHTRSPQRVAPDRARTQSHLHFAPSTRTISAEGCAGHGRNAISPAFRALDTRDLRKGLRRTEPERNLTCISRPRHARSPQRVAPDRARTQSHLHFAPLTRAVSAEGCVSWCSDGAAPALREKEKKSER